LVGETQIGIRLLGEKRREGLRGVNQKLEEQFDNAAAAAERSFKPSI
jgi:hypothetical protein